MDSESSRLFVWNWVPSRYVAPCRWSALGDLPRPVRGSRAERAMSLWLIERYGLSAYYLRGKLPFTWLSETFEGLEKRAFEVGVASCSATIARTLARREILYVRSILGDAVYDQALNYAETYPALAGCAMDWTPAACSEADFIQKGAGLLGALLLPFGSGAAERLQLRFDFDVLVTEHLSDRSADELVSLLEQKTSEPDTAFVWLLPEFEVEMDGQTVVKGT